MAWEENSRICLHMQLIAILSRIGVNNDISIQELYELLQNATLCDITKLPPRLVLTIKGTNYHQTFFICDNYIKDDKRKIYRCKKNIEKELKKIIKNRSKTN